MYKHVQRRIWQLNHNYEVYLFSKYAKARAHSPCLFCQYLQTEVKGVTNVCGTIKVNLLWIIESTRVACR
jgi:hypothetical protein